MDTSPRKSYPRALPFRSPDDITAAAERRHEEMQDRIDDLVGQACHLRRWNHALGLALVGAVVVATTLTVLLVQRPNPPAISRDAVDTPPLAALPPPLPPKKPAPTPSTAPGPAAKDTALEALGGLSAANLYQSYLAIGLLADGVQNKAFTTEGASSTLKLVTSCVSLVDAKLAKLEQTSLAPDDVASLQQVKAVTALMRVQARALETYWSTGQAEHGVAYQRARKATWTGLSKVLGVEGG